MRSAIELGFPVPHRQPPAKGFPLLSRKALDAWLTELPTGNPESAAAKILDLLHQVNRTLLVDEERLQLVQSVGEPAGDILQSLHRKLSDVAAPPTRKEMELAELAMLAHSELTLAYRSAIDCRPGKKLFHKKDGWNPATNLQRAVHHLYQNLKLRYLTKLQPEQALWRHLYTLYQYAQVNGLNNDPVLPLPTGNTHGIDTLFKTALLLHLSGTQSLRGNEMLMLCDLLPALSATLDLLSAENGGDRLFGALVGLQGGTPPVLSYVNDCRDCESAATCLWMDLLPFAQAVRRRLTKLKKTDTGTSMSHATELRVLEQLKTRFGGKLKRQTKRNTAQLDVEVIVSLQHAHAWLTNPRKFQDSESPRQSKPKKRPPSKIDYNVVLNLEQVTIEAPAYFDSDNSQTAQLVKKPRRALCKTMNFSIGGFCLHADKTDDFQVRVGELLILRENNAQRWLPAVVTWLNSDGHGVQFGARLLAPHVQPGKALCQGNHDTHSTQCLLLFSDDSDTPSSIVVGPRCMPEGTEIAVDFGNHSLDMMLRHELSRTQGYVQYACDHAKERDIAPETEILSPGSPEFVEGTNISSQEFEDDDKPWRRFLG